MIMLTKHWTMNLPLIRQETLQKLYKTIFSVFIDCDFSLTVRLCLIYNLQKQQLIGICSLLLSSIYQDTARNLPISAAAREYMSPLFTDLSFLFRRLQTTENCRPNSFSSFIELFFLRRVTLFCSTRTGPFAGRLTQ